MPGPPRLRHLHLGLHRPAQGGGDDARRHLRHARLAAPHLAPGGGRTLQFTSLSFDVSFQEIFATWCAGGTLVLVSEDVRRDPPALCRLLAAERVERLFLPFVALQQLAMAALAERPCPAPSLPGCGR